MNSYEIIVCVRDGNEYTLCWTTGRENHVQELEGKLAMRFYLLYIGDKTGSR
jgi:hypothetical protein